jgi:hypothetical protein
LLVCRNITPRVQTYIVAISAGITKDLNPFPHQKEELRFIINLKKMKPGAGLKNLSRLFPDLKKL